MGESISGTLNLGKRYYFFCIGISIFTLQLKICTTKSQRISVFFWLFIDPELSMLCMIQAFVLKNGKCLFGHGFQSLFFGFVSCGK